MAGLSNIINSSFQQNPGKKDALIPEKRDESVNLYFVWSPGGGPEQGSGGAAPAEALSLGLVRPKQFPAKHREKRGLGNETMLL